MRLLFILSSLLIYFISSAQAQYQTSLLDAALTKNANAVVRFDELHVSLNSKNSMSIQRSRVVTVLNESGNKYAMPYVGYDNGRKVKDISLIIYDKEGKVVDKFRKKDFKDASAVDGSTLYSDSRVKYYPYMPIDYPYSMELVYELSTSNTGEIPAVWPLLEDFMISTEKSRLVIEYASPQLKPIIKEKNFDGIDFKNLSTDTSLVYLAENIAAFKNESYSPSFGKIAPQLLIRPVNFHYEGYDATINDWNDLGIWMHKNLLSKRDELPVGTKEIVKNLVKNETDDLEKAKIVYKYVQENTRYISVQVGIGGIQPISAIEVDRVKYGDCKGLSNYTKALLKAVGVDAYYVHVEAGSDKIGFEEDFPNLAQGNHVILAIPYQGKYFWIDCTSQIHPFGFIGDFTDDRTVFVIKPDGGELVKTTSYLNNENYQKSKANCDLDSDGGITGEIIIQSKGIQYDNKFGIETQSDDTIKKYYKNYWGTINNLDIETYQFSNEMETVEFIEDVQINARKYASKNGERILFAPNIFNRLKNVPPRYQNRKLPFEIQRGFLDEDEYFIAIPQGYVLESIPEPIDIQNQFGSYRISIEEFDGKVKLTRKLAINQGHYPKENYKEYRSFLKQITKYDASKVVLKSNI